MPVRARLVLASPAPDAVLGAPPDTLQMRFTEDLVADGSRAVMTDEHGETVSRSSSVDARNPKILRTELAIARSAARDAPGQRYSVRWQTRSARSGDIATGTYTFVVQAGVPTRPRLQAWPAQAEVQQRLTIVGSGFTPGDQIALTIGDDDEQLGRSETDQHGAFSTALPLPSDVPFGTQPIWARDTSGAKAAASVDVRWGGWPPLRVYTLAKPGPNVGEVSFTVVGRNRSDYVLEGVRIALQIPPDAEVVTAGDGARQESGELVWDEGVLDRTTLVPRTAIMRTAGQIVGRARVEFRHRRASGCIGDDCLPAFVDATYSESGAVSPSD